MTAPKQRSKKRQDEGPEDVCFVISPIGREGTEAHQAYRDVLDYVIRPAVEHSGYRLKVIRADDIERAGSFIKDILEYISSSYIVIADLTGQNPNVFYELGVRHALSNRTILVSQSREDIPSDLREYRTIIYETSAKGAAIFREQIEAYLKDIYKSPGRSDNPVSDRIQSVLDTHTAALRSEIEQLRSEVAALKAKNTVSRSTAKSSPDEEPLSTRIDRIFRLWDVYEEDIFRGGEFVSLVNGETKKFTLPVEERRFHLHTRRGLKGTSEFLYVAQVGVNLEIEKLYADMRVLMHHCCQSQEVKVTFLLVTSNNLTKEEMEQVKGGFERLKHHLKTSCQELYTISVWDNARVVEVERELGIKIDL